MDVLSEVLKVVTLRGALFYNGEFSAPWSIYAAPSRALANFFQTGTENVIVFHLLTEGRAWTRLEDGDRLPLDAGDIVMIPHGDRHIVENGRSCETVEGPDDLAGMLSQGLKLWQIGGGGEVSKFICGYMAYDSRLGQTVLSGLPPLFKVSIRNHPSGRWLENSIRFLVDQAGNAQPGGEAVLAKLSEVLFIEALRAYIAQLPPSQTGWLASARDPAVGSALALMHRDPAHPWTLAALARDVGMSRSVLAERFRQYLNESPIGYLTRWRLQLGAQILCSSNHSVAQVAAEVGYDSEAAFNRAFKREFNLPPARFRGQARAAA